MRDTHDVDMSEWRRLRHLRQLLEPLAYIFERTNSECKGHCERPRVVYVDPTTGERITCCNLRPPWERYHETRKLEKVMSQKVQLGKKPYVPAQNRRVESPLKDAYPRSHTGTWIGKKIDLKDFDDTKDHPQVKPKVRPKDH